MDAIASQIKDNGPAPADRPDAISLRRAAPNLNHWYAVSTGRELGTEPRAVTLWHQAIVLYRDAQGQAHALEDRCPHRQVRLSEGAVKGNHLVCAYHGWEFNPSGTCAHVPYLETNQKLPSCKIRQYPVQEQNGFVWLYPGDMAAMDTEPAPLPLPEWDHLNYIAAVTVIDVNCHFSFLIENLMDMYHGHLHQDLQAWTEPVLRSLESSDSRVDAHYDAQSYYRINKIWSVSQLFIPALRQIHPEPLDVSYVYPNWIATLGQDFKIGCLFCPVDETHTRAYLLHFTSLQAFHRLHKLPVWFRRWIKNRLFNAAQPLLDGLVRQDVLMLEQEQQSFEQHPDRKGPELNRALMDVQRLIQRQATMNAQQ